MGEEGIGKGRGDEEWKLGGGGEGRDCRGEGVGKRGLG